MLINHRVKNLISFCFFSSCYVWVDFDDIVKRRLVCIDGVLEQSDGDCECKRLFAVFTRVGVWRSLNADRRRTIN